MSAVAETGRPAAPYPSEAADPDVLDPGQEALLLQGAQWDRFAVIGDSVAEGVGEPQPGYANVPWADRVARALRERRPGLAYLNIGERGRTSFEVRDLQLGRALAFDPDLAAICCGGNDMFAKDFDAQRTGTEIDLMALQLAECGSQVLLCSLFDITQAIEMPGKLGERLRARQESLYAEIREVAERRGAIFTDLVAHPRSADPAIYASDMIHCSMSGHAIAASATIRSIGSRLWAGQIPGEADEAAAA
jgi:lysophospholipase L1-like esterase